MPDYKADLEWLRINHPEEYDRIPAGLLGNPAYVQQHLSGHETTADGEREWWVIGFAAADDDAAVPDYFVDLEIPRPEADHEPPARCPHHTLSVSRSLCPVCGSNPT